MRKKLLLHTCCGPCLLGSIDSLKDYDITILFYNPNICDSVELQKRQEALMDSIEYIKNCFRITLDLIIPDYNHNAFLKNVNGFETCKENGDRCKICIKERLDYSAKLTQQMHYDLFATTLTLSPHKDYEYINSCGKELANKYNVEYLESNFKKNNGFFNSVERSKILKIYRQPFCGCEYSK